MQVDIRKIRSVSDKGVDNLRVAIVINSVEDFLLDIEKWRIADKKVKSGKILNKKDKETMSTLNQEEQNEYIRRKNKKLKNKKKRIKRDMKNIVKFFKGNWYKTLIYIDGSLMLMGIKKKINKEKCLWNIYLSTYTKVNKM